MPPVVAAAAIGGAASLGGGLLAARGASGAQKAQSQANMQNQALARMQFEEDKRRYDQEFQSRQSGNALQEQIRRQILKKYGYDVPDGAPAPGGGPMAAPGAATSGPPGGAPAPGGGMSFGGDLNAAMRSLAGMPKPEMRPGDELIGSGNIGGQPPAPQATGTLADFAGPQRNWSDWRNNGAV